MHHSWLSQNAGYAEWSFTSDKLQSDDTVSMSRKVAGYFWIQSEPVEARPTIKTEAAQTIIISFCHH